MNKKIFDITASFAALLLLGLFIFLCWVVAAIDTRSNGLFFQSRIGQFGKPFQIFKLKTIHPKKQTISAMGRFLRKSKLDELPQLFNVLLGDMSFVGPRPDVPGYYDQLQGEARKILELKPGLTSPASLKYFNEAYLLSQQENSLKYNDTVIFPDKVRMNLTYYYDHSFWGDIRIICNTVFRR
ncbi:sugar transferase [Flavobacterium sp.]|uniref:sugar transferase n=1 Tax=Flavobacterium sp. TaxID=239 RepID=UPI002B4B5178|nr:sugar transferase [Flavobacterium sp.]HLF51195.1 sugar transferase [Flavobacterium sp.]